MLGNRAGRRSSVLAVLLARLWDVGMGRRLVKRIRQRGGGEGAAGALGKSLRRKKAAVNI